MKSWAKLEQFCADFLSDLGWIRRTKKHFGDKIWDIEGQGFKGECKHYKAHKIHTIKNDTDLKYGDDCLIFTKVKRTHYTPNNVYVTISLKLLREFLELYKVKNSLRKDTKTLNYSNSLNTLKYKVGNTKVLLSDINKIIKKMEEVK